MGRGGVKRTKNLMAVWPSLRPFLEGEGEGSDTGKGRGQEERARKREGRSDRQTAEKVRARSGGYKMKI